MCFFFFNDTATTEIYTLSLHDALPIYPLAGLLRERLDEASPDLVALPDKGADEDLLLGALDLLEHRLVEPDAVRSEEHTSELQSRQYLVCRLLLEKKKKKQNNKLLTTS